MWANRSAANHVVELCRHDPCSHMSARRATRSIDAVEPPRRIRRRFASNYGLAATQYNHDGDTVRHISLGITLKGPEGRPTRNTGLARGEDFGALSSAL
jgi:hypothetical protein